MVKQNPLRVLKAEVERCGTALTQSFAMHTEKTREANDVFGVNSNSKSTNIDIKLFINSL